MKTQIMTGIFAGFKIRVGTECGKIQAAAEFCSCDLVIEGMECAQLLDPGGCIPLIAQGLHFGAGDAVDEKVRRGGGDDSEKEVVALARPRGALL
jgi:hypothetical protein